MLGEGNTKSFVNRNGFKIGGSLNEGDINPITQDKIIKNKFDFLLSKSTAKEIEVWLIKLTK